VVQITAEPGTLTWYAQTAQAQGLQTYNFSAGIAEYPLPSWDIALSKSTVVLAQLIEARSYPSGYEVDYHYVERCIDTWYKFRVLERWQQRDASCSNCSDIIVQPPSEMLPLNADEIILRKQGGTLVVDSVTLNSDEPDFPAIPVGTQCILLLEKYPAEVQSWLWLGPDSVYPVLGADQFGVVATLDATGNTSNSNGYTDELQNRYAFSISSFRAALTGNTPTPTATPSPAPSPVCAATLAEKRACVRQGGVWDNESCACN
jgi:hypothetical protein